MENFPRPNLQTCPNEILTQIFRNLKTKDLIRLRMVSRRIQDVVQLCLVPRLVVNELGGQSHGPWFDPQYGKWEFHLKFSEHEQPTCTPPQNPYRPPGDERCPEVVSASTNHFELMCEQEQEQGALLLLVIQAQWRFMVNQLHVNHGALNTHDWNLYGILVLLQLPLLTDAHMSFRRRSSHPEWCKNAIGYAQDQVHPHLQRLTFLFYIQDQESPNRLLELGFVNLCPALTYLRVQFASSDQFGIVDIECTTVFKGSQRLRLSKIISELQPRTLEELDQHAIILYFFPKMASGPGQED